MASGVLLATKLTGLVFVTTSMVSAGICVKPVELVGQLRRTRLVTAAVIANFVATPLIAWLLCKLMPMESDFEIGLILVSGAAGAPMLPKLAERARGNATFAIMLMMLLVCGTVAFLPLAMPRLLPGLQASPLKIALPLLIVILLPLFIGMFMRWNWEAICRRAEGALRRIAEVSLIVFIVMVLATHLHALWGAVGSGAILAALLLVSLSGSAAFALGGPGRDTRRVLALGTAQRNIAAALVVAGSSFPDQPDVLVMLLVSDVVGIIVLLIAVELFRRADTLTAGGARRPVAMVSQTSSIGETSSFESAGSGRGATGG